MQTSDRFPDSKQQSWLTGSGRQRLFARQGTGHWAAIVPAARAVTSTLRMNGLAAALAAVQRGARVLRVHDVAATVDALRVWQALESRNNTS